MPALVGAVAMLAGLLAGCETLWDWGNRGPLARDVTELFGRHGVVVRDPACHMLGTTRAATCQIRASADEVTALAGGLRLVDAAVGGAGADTLRQVEGSSPPGCHAARLVPAGTVRVWVSARRTPELRLASGGAFEYLLLYQGLATGHACVQVAYAYG
jgi:hypothetical protein